MPQPNEFMLKKEEAEDKYQKKLTAGTNITINPVTNEISAAGGGSTVTYAGTYSYGDSLGALTINGNVSQIKTPNLVPGNNVNITRDTQTGAITISSTGGDDANVEPNPDGEPTDTLSTLGVDGEIIDYYLQEGLIGTSGGSYITCNLDKNLIEDEYIAVITDADETQYVKTFEYDGTNNVTIQWTDSGKSFTLVITSTTAGLTSYSGSWRDIYCDIYTKSYGQIIYEVGGDKRGLEYFKETPTSLYGESVLSVMTDPRFVFDDQVSVTFRAQGGTHTWSTQAGVTTGIAQTHVIRSLSGNTWQGIFQMSDDPSDLGIYYKFVKDNWWDVDSEGTMTWDNCPNAMIYPCSSNVNAYGCKDSFEKDGKTYYLITIGSNQIDFTTSRVGTYAPSTLYLPNYDGHAENPDRPDNGYYRTLGEFGNYLLTTSESFYYNGLSMDKKLAFFAGGEDENGTNAPIKIYIDGTTEGLLTEYDFDNSDMTGATSSTNGEHGLVPQPLIADKDKILKGNGTWGTINLEDLANVNLSNLSDEQILKYNLLTQKWENADESGGSSDKVTEVYDVIASGDDCYIVVDQHIWLDDGGGSITRSTAAYEDITSVNGFIARLTQTAMDDGGSSYNTDVTFSFDDVNKTVTMSWTTLSGNSGCYVDIVYTKVSPTIIANDLVVTGTNSVTYNIAEIVQGYQNLVSSNFMFNLKHIYSDSRGLGTSSPFNINFNQATGILTVSWNNIGSYNELTGDVLLLYRPNGYRKILDMVGATDELNGYHGYTPAPLIGDENKFLKGDGTWAYPQSGAEVIANPTGTATDTLNTISIDGTIYEIEGSGSGGEGTQIDVLFSKTPDNTHESTITLSNSLFDYDMITIDYAYVNNTVYHIGHSYMTDDLNIGDNIGFESGGGNTWYSISNNTTLTLAQSQTTWCVVSIIGTKYGSGGSGGGSNFESTTLYTGTQRETTINLNDDYTNYDFILVQGLSTASTGYLNSTLISVDDISTNNHIGISDDASFIWYVVTDSDTFTYDFSSGEYYIKAIYGLKESEGGGGNFYKKTTAEYQALPLSDKEDPDKLYFIDNSGEQITELDNTNWVNSTEASMSISIINNKLTYAWSGGTSIGANSVYSVAIPASVDKIRFKITTGTSYYNTYDPTIERFKVFIGVRPTYTTGYIHPPNLSDWLALKDFSTDNGVWENELDLSNVSEDSYLYISGHGWNMTIDSLQLVTNGKVLDPNYSYYTYQNEQIVVRVYHEGENDEQILWFFNGWEQTSGDMAIPSSLSSYKPTDSTPIYSANYPDGLTTQDGWIGFYNNNIRAWTQSTSSITTGTMYGVVDINDGSRQINPYENPYIYLEPKNCIYYQNIKYADNASGGNVDDVYVNGESVLDTNKIAQVKTHKEVSLAEYEDANDDIIYFVDDDDDELGIYYSPIIYSTEEREVGTWTNGKPLYEKTIYIGSMTKNSSWNPIAHNINDIEKVIKLCGQTKQSSDDRMYNIPHYRPYDNTGISIGADTTYIYYMNTWLEYASDTYVTIQYTKTTDTPGSAKYNALGVPMVHYSTDEQVIGTWIDGKPLYRQTYRLTSGIVTGSYGTIALSSDISVKDYKGFISRSNGAVDKFNSYMDLSDTLKLSKRSNGMEYYISTVFSNITELCVTLEYTKITD